MKKTVESTIRDAITELEKAQEAAQAKFDDGSEDWQASDKGEELSEALDALNEEIETLGALADLFKDATRIAVD